MGEAVELRELEIGARFRFPCSDPDCPCPPGTSHGDVYVLTAKNVGRGIITCETPKIEMRSFPSTSITKDGEKVTKQVSFKKPQKGEQCALGVQVLPVKD